MYMKWNNEKRKNVNLTEKYRKSYTNTAHSDMKIEFHQKNDTGTQKDNGH